MTLSLFQRQSRFTRLFLSNRSVKASEHRHWYSSISSASSASVGSSPSVNEDEIKHFSKLSAHWWDESGEFGLLHKMNPVRMKFVREKLIEVAQNEDMDTSQEAEHSVGVLTGLDVLDVGCGGGLLSESLARLGARTLGVDASPQNIAIASLHASQDPMFNSTTSSLSYRHASAEQIVAEEKRFDVVCSMEVLEHVDNPSDFLRSCAELVKPGGHLFLSTIARTTTAYLLTILAAEHVLRLVEPGTHTFRKYVNPSELLQFFQKPLNPATGEGAWIGQMYDGIPSLREAEVRGIMYLPWTGSWALAPRSAPGSTMCNYLFWVRKPNS